MGFFGQIIRGLINKKSHTKLLAFEESQLNMFWGAKYGLKASTTFTRKF